MNLKGDFFLKKKDEYSDKQIKCIKEAVEVLDELGSRPLMMLGKVQSGKTKAFIGVMALSFDNGYDISIVLTKSSNALVKQTTTRLQNEFQYFVKEDYLDVYDIMNMPKQLSNFELEKKIVIVVKKQKDNLRKLMTFIQENKSKKYLVIDDEADYASIGYEKNKLTDEFDLRRIAGQINDLRLAIDCRFIQVTATPYALYLQPDEVASFEPVKPAKTVLVPSGKGYIGGDYYFRENEAGDPFNRQRHLFKMIDENELVIMKHSDRRRFKIEDAVESPKIAGLRTAILTFLVGGCIRILQNGGSPRGPRNKFSFIIHTEIAKSSHENQCLISEAIIAGIKILPVGQLIQLIQPIYKELSEAIESYGTQTPPFNEVLELFKKSMEWVMPVVVNSEKDMESLLDETGQLRLRSPFTIFLGGQILDRGITVANLIGFYYGRRPRKMQQDTVLQHARMFGYRDPLDLAVTRFYTTLDIYERMRKINEIDHQLREDFEQDKLNQGVIFIGSDLSGAIVPCSPNKIMMSNPNIIKSHKRIVPYGFQTKTKTAMRTDLNRMDKIIKKYIGDELKGQFNMSKTDAIRLIEHFYEMIEESESLSVNKKDFLGILEYLSTTHVHVLTRVNRDMPRLAANGEYITAPEGGAMISAARELAKKEPTLILLRQKGRKDQGWKEAEFWWPILVAPRSTPTSMFTSEIEL